MNKDLYPVDPDRLKTAQAKKEKVEAKDMLFVYPDPVEMNGIDSAVPMVLRP